MIFLQSLAFYLRRGRPLALGFCPSPLIHVDTSDLNLQFITFNHENVWVEYEPLQLKSDSKLTLSYCRFLPVLPPSSLTKADLKTATD